MYKFEFAECRYGSEQRRRTWFQRLGAGAATIVLAAGLAAFSVPAEAADPTKVVVNYEHVSISVIYKLAKDKGFYEKNGLDVELFPGGPGSAALSLLINGQLNVVPLGVQGAILAASAGLPIVLVSGANVEYDDPKLGAAVATVASAESGVESFKGLEGKTVGINSATCCWGEFTQAAVEAEGGDPTAVKFLQVPFPNQLQALRNGQVDAITTVQPFLTIAKLGGGKILGPTSLVAQQIDEAAGQVAVMSTDFIAKNPGVVEAWQKAMAEAMDYARANPGEVRALFLSETKIDEKLVDQLPPPRWTATINKTAYDASIAFMIRQGALTADKVPDADKFLAPGAVE